MSQKIRQDDIDKVREATDIVAVAEETLAVKRQRNVAWALCPFHQEKTPSFKMDSTTGLYYCFGCGQAGNVFQFLERTQGLTFTEAVERLASRAGIALQYEGTRSSSGRDKLGRLIRAIEAAVAFYHECLLTQAGEARSYLKSRGIGSAEAEHFQLGFSPSGRDVLVRHLRESGFTEDELLKSGLAFRNERGRLADQFRERIMFPIFDPSDKPIAFGARAMGDVKPKYKNSAAGIVYDKSKTLYGLNWARREIVASRSVIIVEGYTDVIGLHQIGIANSVATCGTAMGEGHFEMLRRFGPAGTGQRLKVLLAFDADAAGEAASRRGFELQHKFGFDVRVAELPPGTDPADAARTSPEQLRNALENAVPLLRFKLRSDLAIYDLTVPDCRADALRAAATSVALHPDHLVRHEYAQEIAHAIGIDVETVRTEIESVVKGDARRDRPWRSVTSETSESTSPGLEIAPAEIIKRLDQLDALVLKYLLIGSDEMRAALVALGDKTIRGKGAKKAYELLATPARPNPASVLGALDESDPLRVVIGHVMLEDDGESGDEREQKVLAHAERRVLKAELERLAGIIKGDHGSDEITDAIHQYNEIQARVRALT